MELNTRSFMLMAVTLVVGIVLIAGVVVPVISDVSSNGGDDDSGESFTNEGTGFLTKTDQSTSVTYYPVSNNKYSTQPDSVADRPVYDAPLYILATDNTYMIRVLEEQGGPSYFQVFSLDHDAGAILSDMLTLSGTTLTFTPRGESTAVTKSNIMYYPTETGAYTFVTFKDMGQTPEYGTYYALENTPVYCFGLLSSSGMASFTINGTSQTNTVTVFGADTYSDSAEITLTDNQITDISFTIVTTDISIDPGSLDGETIGMFYMVLPVEVGGSSGGSDVPEYLSSLLSVIPLLMIVGLILGVLAFLRMKN